MLSKAIKERLREALDFFQINSYYYLKKGKGSFTLKEHNSAFLAMLQANCVYSNISYPGWTGRGRFWSYHRVLVSGVTAGSRMPPGKNRPSKPAVCPQLGMRWACLEKKKQSHQYDESEILWIEYFMQTQVPSDFLNTEVENINTAITVHININNVQIIYFVLN